MTSDPILEDSGERMIPSVHRPSLLFAEHYTRYLAARELVRGKRVLDIASGSGYGSDLLAETAAHVIGVDVSEQAVEYSRSHYSRKNLEYRVGDATSIPADDSSIDVLVTFETIEHVADYSTFLAEIARVLAPDGIALISTPNDMEFAEGNHFHLHEFVYGELLELAHRHFDYIDPYFQATWKSVAIGTEAMLSSDGPVAATLLNLDPLEPEKFLYFYLVCSRQPITSTVSPLVALGGHYSDRSVQAEASQQSTALANQVDEIARLTALLAEQTAEQELISASRVYRAARRASAVARALGLTRR